MVAKGGVDQINFKSCYLKASISLVTAPPSHQSPEQLNMPIIPLQAFLEKGHDQNNPFDYLVVGGGATGLAVANRYACAEMLAAILTVLHLI